MRPLCQGRPDAYDPFANPDDPFAGPASGMPRCRGRFPPVPSTTLLPEESPKAAMRHVGARDPR
ncbi:hypothetical protein GCM10027055_00620 [Janibacter alkaliphilus]